MQQFLSLRMLKNAILECVEAGARELRHFINEDFMISNKEGINNLVTEVDHASEKAIINVIKKHFPEHHILSEEAGNLIQDSQYKWIIDPIDGTVNFAHRIPICCISIAVEYENKIVVAAIYNPFMKELYFGMGIETQHQPVLNVFVQFYHVGISMVQNVVL